MEQPSRQEIWKMFDKIAPTYDKVNRVMTFGVDRYWRKKLCQFVPRQKELHILDCATGTGDQMLALLKHVPKIKTIVGVDLAAEMLDIGKEKLKNHPQTSFVTAGMEKLPFADGTFDCVTVSFGIRNVTDVSLSLREAYRVLKSGGRLLILEGSLPTNRFVKPLHLFYLRHLLPRIGQWISKNKAAYVYLNKTIETFPCGNAFVKLMEDAGFSCATSTPLTGGCVTIYQGDKR